MATRKPKAAPPDDGVVWRTKYRGIPIRIGLRDLTVQRLLQCKAWFGPEYGIPGQFLALLLQNEAGAVMCAVWIGLQKAKKPIEDARDLDFNLVDDLEKLEDPAVASDGEGEGDEPAATTTGDSIETA